MKKVLATVIGLVLGMSLVVFTVGCGKKEEAGSLEKLGKSADATLKDAKETVKDAKVPDAEAAKEDTKKKVDEAAE